MKAVKHMPHSSAGFLHEGGFIVANSIETTRAYAGANLERIKTILKKIC